MYSSTIQPSVGQPGKAGGFGLGRLESMGRMVKESPEATVASQEVPAVTVSPPTNVLSFRPKRPERPKMAASAIFPQKNAEEFTRFPSFNL